MPPIQPESLIGRMFENGFNQGNFTLLEELLAPGATTHITAWGLPNNRMGFKQIMLNLRTAFPDLHCTVEDEIRTGNKAAARWTLRGTHQGVYLGAPPTGRAFVVQGMAFALIENGRIHEVWALFDQMSLLQQLGLVPPGS